MASQFITVFLTTLVALSLTLQWVEGNRLLREEKLEIPRNSTITSVETVYGDIYDCVDIYKQPALNHPLLKGHKIQMRPSKEVEDMLATLPSMKADCYFKRQRIWLKNGCPQGTVPIRRMTRKHLEKSSNASQKLQFPSLDSSHEFLDFAGIVVAKNSRAYHGASASIILYNPAVEPHQYSSAAIFVESGDSSQLNQIQVNPELYGDERTRLYTYWTANNHQSTGCYNMHCPGLVIINPNLLPDLAFPHTSTVEGEQFDVGLTVTRNVTTGVWYLHYEGNQTIGYWPSSFFTSLSHPADTIRWGGQVYTPSSDDVSPPMGNGQFNNGQYQKTCYMRQVLIADETKLFPPDDSLIRGVDSRCYYEADHSLKSDAWWRYSFLFGGAGGKDHSTCVY